MCGCFLCVCVSTCTRCRQSTWGGTCVQGRRPPLPWWSCRSGHSVCRTGAGSPTYRCTRPSSGRSPTEPGHSYTLRREQVRGSQGSGRTKHESNMGQDVNSEGSCFPLPIVFSLFYTCLCVCVCMCACLCCVYVCLHTWLLAKSLSSRQWWANLLWWEYNDIISGKGIFFKTNVTKETKQHTASSRHRYTKSSTDSFSTDGEVTRIIYCVCIEGECLVWVYMCLCVCVSVPEEDNMCYSALPCNWEWIPAGVTIQLRGVFTDQWPPWLLLSGFSQSLRFTNRKTLQLS